MTHYQANYQTKGLADWLWRLRTAAFTGLLFIPGWSAMWTMVWRYRLGLTPNLSTRALWQLPVLSGVPAIRDISGASGKVGKGNENLLYSSLWDFKRSSTCRKILHGTSGFTSHPKVCWGSFITLKKSIALAGFEPATFGSSGKHNNHTTTKATN
jgi:hypothetical protein